MSDFNDADILDEARASLPTYIVADSPDGDVLSHEGGYPGDDTKVWLAKGGSDDDTTTMGDLYAEYGDDLIAYAEPEEAGVTASLAATEAGSARTLDDDGFPAGPPVDVAEVLTVIADRAGLPPEALGVDKLAPIVDEGNGMASTSLPGSPLADSYRDASLADLTPEEQAAFGQVKADRQVAELVAAAVHDPTDENMEAAVAALEGAADEWLTAKQDNGEPVTASMVMEELIGDANGLSTLKGWDLTPTEPSTPGYAAPPPGFPTAESTIARFEQGLISSEQRDQLLAPLIPIDTARPRIGEATGEPMTEVSSLPGLDVSVTVEPGITAAMGHEAIDRLEGFLTLAEDKLGITAAMHGPGIISRQTARMAVGENAEAQAEVVAAFEANYVQDQNEFVTTVLGPPPAPNADHDEAAYEALAREARLWHARHTASTVRPPA